MDSSAGMENGGRYNDSGDDLDSNAGMKNGGHYKGSGDDLDKSAGTGSQTEDSTSNTPTYSCKSNKPTSSRLNTSSTRMFTTLKDHSPSISTAGKRKIWTILESNRG